MRSVMRAFRDMAAPARAFAATSTLVVVWASAEAQSANDEAPPFQRELELFMGGGFEMADDVSGMTIDGGMTAWRGRWGVGMWVSGLPSYFDYHGSVSPAVRGRFMLGRNGFCQGGFGFVHLFLGPEPKVEARLEPLILYVPVPYLEFQVGNRNRPVAWSVGGRIGGPVGLQVVVMARLFRQGG